ncbi:MAG: signal peptidase II, partial [Gammaproteobacteria bacterium]
VLVHWLRRLPREQLRMAIALSLILGGAIGNVIDRIWFGHVIDFIQLYYRDWYWPAFNVADSAITVGAVLLIWDGLFGKQETTHKGNL